jgi:PAS domain S-box-containing protein
LEKTYSEIKRAQEVLRDSQSLFRNLFEYHATVQLVIDPDNGKIIYANNSAATFYGWTREQLLQMRIQDINTLSPEKIKQAMEKARANQRIHFEFHHRMADGSIRDVEVVSSKIEARGKDLLHSIIHDITARKQAEKALKESEESFSQLFESAPVPMAYATDVDGYRGTTWNEAWHQTFGYTREQANGRSGNDIGLWVNPPDRSRFVELAKRQNYVGNFETLLRRRDGSIRNCALFARFIDKSGYRLLMVVYLDITDRKRAEDALRFNQFAIDRMADAAFWMTSDARIFYVNQAACSALGYSQDELIGMTVTDVDPEFSMAMWSEYWKELRQKGHIVFQTTHRAKDGHSYPVEIQANFLEFGGREYNCTFARDITERKRVDEEREQLQAQLNQAQKMESVGRLAGGVAHDFNNMLGAILGYTELGLQGISPADPIHGTLTDIQKAAQRSVNLTRQLLAFARKQTVAPKLLDLNETIEGTIKMLQRLIGEHIELSWLPGRDLGPVRMDPSQIEQLLANLCVNARDAIHDTGKIIIETGTVTLDETFCAAHVGFTPGKYVLLTVSDDGCGMEAETLSHLFEPFFTTKEVGKGTGLGLATVYGIVKQNNGFIDTYSEPCLGTTFKIYLPRYATEAGRIAKTGSAQSAANGHETILLVEDEPMILDITGKMLECQGYTVMAAATPGEAIRLAREHSGDIHLLMTDVVMPEMNGRELAKNLLSLYPKLKRLFMSGYTADVIAHHGVLDEGVQFIQKPFSGQTIAAKVREVLEEKKYSTKKSLSDSRESMIRKN